jgi:hypothetical protein
MHVNETRSNQAQIDEINWHQIKPTSIKLIEKIILNQLDLFNKSMKLDDIESRPNRWNELTDSNHINGISWSKQAQIDEMNWSTQTTSMV